MARKKGGRRGSKAKKTSKSKYKFRDARMQYHLGHFAKAESILRQAAISPAEKEKAQELKINIHHQLAYQYFSQHQYQELLKLLKETDNLSNTALIKNQIFTGLSHLYLGEFQKAKEDLKIVITSKETASFSFYYLLADLYQNHTTYHSEQDFLEFQANFVAPLEAHHKVYLSILFHIFNQNIKKAIEEIKNFDVKSRTQRLNMDALEAILSNDAFQTRSIEKIKPLYKLLLNFSLSTEEKTFLASFPNLELALEQQDLLADFEHVRKGITNLCQNGEAIPIKYWLSTYQQIPEKYQAYLIYNQVAALFNEDLEDGYRDICRILSTPKNPFFTLPDSLFLYLHIVIYDVDSHSFQDVWKNITNHIQKFAQLLTPGQFNYISWNLEKILVNYNRRDYINYKDNIQLLAEQYQMIGLKFWMILEQAINEKGALPNEASDLFTSKEIQNSKQFLLPSLNEFKEALHLHNFLDMFMFDAKDLPKERYLHKVLNRLQTQLFKAFSVENIHPSAKAIIFDIYLILIGENKKALEDKQHQLSLSNYEALKENYLKTLIYFDENKPESFYYKGYRTLLSMKDKEEILQLLQGRMTQNKKKRLKAIAQTDSGIESVFDVFFDLIDHSHFDDDLIVPLSSFFQLLGQENLKKATLYANKFMERYLNELKAKHQCEHPDEFFLKFLETSIKKFDNVLFGLFYHMARLYPLPLLHNKSALQYRVIGFLLEHIMTVLKKAPKAPINMDFNQQLLLYLGAKIKRDKRLKKLKKTHQEATAFFENYNK